jgi:hypothetical protein
MCERYDEHHIGKRSDGWQFIVRGWRGAISGTEFTATSWAQWKEHILSGGAVYDEYGEEFMPHQFIELVQATMTPDAQSACEYHKHHNSIRYDPNMFNDKDGYSICYSEFS